MTDEDLITIRDNHLPSQGDAFDCIAFARDVLKAQGDPVLQGKLMHRLGALTSVADAVCKQFALAGIAAKVDSMNPAEDLHGRAQMALHDAALTEGAAGILLEHCADAGWHRVDGFRPRSRRTASGGALTMYARHNPNVCFVWPALALGVDIDGRFFFEAAWLCWAAGIGGA